ncbi:copper chaperone for superoxide dismutase isoform X2 [Ambystoma mexicanum]|uniref:copper chaperone for superoxide dismutase isoform X2 n=1 Tax=Ambystoma mexicanum TaxID=8296 RepID=UPI0037E90508
MLEFAVQMTCQSCVQAIERCLQGIKGVQAVQVSLDSESVLVETTLTAEEVQNLLESTGRLAVLKGMGGSIERDLGAAVTMMEGANCIQGVVRFVQVSEDKCIVEGTIDGLRPGLHGLHVHAFGDLTDSFRKCGDHFNPQMNSHGGPQDPDRHAGDLGNILVDETGRAHFRMEDDRLKVWDIIGRSLVVDEVEDDLGRGEHPLSKITGNSGESEDHSPEKKHPNLKYKEQLRSKLLTLEKNWPEESSLVQPASLRTLNSSVHVTERHFGTSVTEPEATQDAG